MLPPIWVVIVGDLREKVLQLWNQGELCLSSWLWFSFFLPSLSLGACTDSLVSLCCMCYWELEELWECLRKLSKYSLEFLDWWRRHAATLSSRWVLGSFFFFLFPFSSSMHACTHCSDLWHCMCGWGSWVFRGCLRKNVLKLDRSSGSLGAPCMSWVSLGARYTPFRIVLVCFGDIFFVACQGWAGL